MDTIGASEVMKSPAFSSRTHGGRHGLSGAVPLNHVHSRSDLLSGDSYVFQAAGRSWRSRRQVVQDHVVARAGLHRTSDGTRRPRSAPPSEGTGQPMTGDAGLGARSAWGVVAVVAGGGAIVMAMSATGPMWLCVGGLALVAAVATYFCFATAYGWSRFRRRHPQREMAQEQASANPGVAEPAPRAAHSPEQNGERRWFAELRLSFGIGRRSR